jgi:L-lactate dehydrogenase (cytochrome)
LIAACIDDFRVLAKARLPRFLFDYIDGGSYSEATMRSNVADMQALTLRQQVMRDVSAIDLSTMMMGRKVALPIALGPVGLAGLNARRGEVQAARAAEAKGVPFILSAVSCCSLEEVMGAVTGPVMLQLYMIRDRDFMRDLFGRAAALGVDTLVLTVDLAVQSARYRDVRSGLAGVQGLDTQLRRFSQIALRPGWAWDVGVRGGPHTLGNFAPVMKEGAGLSQFLAWVGRNFDASITWKDLDWIRQHWSGRLVIKGVLDPDDALAACDAGADSIIVSNHGGRQLDGAPSTIAALPAVVKAVSGRAEILMDSGIRSGVDVLRALALGAKGVLLGRPWAFALAARGEAGVAAMLDLLRHEMAVAMALTGQTSITDLSPDILLPLIK